MNKCQIKVLTNLENKQEINDFFAIKSDDVIKYIDFDNNKMVIDMNNNIMKRDNNDYLFTIDFNNNSIEILVKSLNKRFLKEIETLLIEKKKKSYLVRYRLSDEKIINEYYVKF